jgi:hypothetical protein
VRLEAYSTSFRSPREKGDPSFYGVVPIGRCSRRNKARNRAANFYLRQAVSTKVHRPRGTRERECSAIAMMGCTVCVPTDMDVATGTTSASSPVTRTKSRDRHRCKRRLSCQDHLTQACCLARCGPRPSPSYGTIPVLVTRCFHYASNKARWLNTSGTCCLPAYLHTAHRQIYNPTNTLHHSIFISHSGKRSCSYLFEKENEDVLLGH